MHVLNPCLSADPHCAVATVATHQNQTTQTIPHGRHRLTRVRGEEGGDILHDRLVQVVVLPHVAIHFKVPVNLRGLLDPHYTPKPTRVFKYIEYIPMFLSFCNHFNYLLLSYACIVFFTSYELYSILVFKTARSVFYTTCIILDL